MKKIIPFLIIVILICACSKNKDTSNTGTNINNKFIQSIRYNNISSEQSLEQIKSLLTDNISGLSLELFLDDINNYNNIMENLQGDYIDADSNAIEYDLEALRDRWAGKYPGLIGNNSRITTFELIKDKIKLNSKDLQGESLMFDNESLAQSNKFDKYELNAFNTYYRNIPTENSSDINIHVQKVKDYYSKINLQYNLPENFSVISVFSHDRTDKNNTGLFVEHSGLLIHSNDKYIFIEKLSFELPYQMIEFNNKQELNDYLMNMYDISWKQKGTRPFIMENSELLAEYRFKSK